ncbi:MAG: hypothetical protein WC584_01535 [Candidatus Pacearchaeota archaeon]
MRERKIGVSAIILMVIIIIITILIYGGSFDKLKKITGYASTTQTVGLNITVGVPIITTVYNNSINVVSGLTEGNSDTNITLNFTVYNTAGTGLINHTTAQINVTRSGQAVRINTSCQRLATASNYVNYTCLVKLWWWDGAGVWNVTASIKDNNSNFVQNGSSTFSLGATTGFVLGPTNLTWSSIGSGAINQTATNDPIILNNTGNVGITSENILINATNLRGETTNTIALWAENFSVGFATGTNAECSLSTSTIMNRTVWAAINIANLTAGNFTENNNYTGQEALYFCLRLAGSELTSQAYSTSNESTWTIKIQ